MTSRGGRKDPSTPTPRQRQVLEFIRGFIVREGFPPTHQEIAAGMGFRSANAAAQHVRLMAQKGLLAVKPGTARGLALRDESEDDGLPVIGEVAAGEPVVAEERIERRLDVDRSLFRPRADYLLRVRGTSMRNAGILPGDLVAVHATREARAGDVAVVRLGNEVTVKRWRPRDGRVLLEAESDVDESIEVDPRTDDVTVEGCVVGLLRIP